MTVCGCGRDHDADRRAALHEWEHERVTGTSLAGRSLRPAPVGGHFTGFAGDVGTAVDPALDTLPYFERRFVAVAFDPAPTFTGFAGDVGTAVDTFGNVLPYFERRFVAVNGPSAPPFTAGDVGTAVEPELRRLPAGVGTPGT